MPQQSFQQQLSTIKHLYLQSIDDMQRAAYAKAYHGFNKALIKYENLVHRHNLTDNHEHQVKLALINTGLAECSLELADLGSLPEKSYYLQQATQSFLRAYDYDPRATDDLYRGFVMLYEVYEPKTTKAVFEQLKGCYERAIQMQESTVNEADYNKLCASFVKKYLCQMFARVAFNEEKYELARQAAVTSYKIDISVQDRQQIINSPLTEIESHQDFELDKAALYNLWGNILLNQIDKVNRDDPQKALKIRLAERVLLKAHAIVKADKSQVDFSGELYFALSQIYEYPIFDNKNLQKAFRYNKEGAETGDVNMLTNLGFKYLYGMGTAIDYHQAYACFQKATAKGSEKSKLLLGHCYISGIGCQIAPVKAFELFEQTNAGPVRDFLLAMSLLNWPHTENLPHNYTNDRILLLLRNAAEHEPGALHVLGQIYHLGFREIAPSYNRAESYYQEALLAGVEPALKQLLQLYTEMLINNDYQATDSVNIKQAAAEILSSVFAIELDEQEKSLDKIVEDLNIKRDKFCTTVNHVILEYAHCSIAPEDKIRKLLQNYYEPVSVVNVTTRVLKIGQLSEQIEHNGPEFIGELTEGIEGYKLDALLAKCEEFMDQKQISTRGLANVVTGWSKLYRLHYDTRLSKLIDKALHQMNGDRTSMNLLSLQSVLAAAVNWPTDNDDNLIAQLAQIIQNTEHLQKQQDETQDKANLLYNLVILDQYRRSQNPSDQPLAVDWHYWFNHAAQALQKPSMLTDPQYTQYSLAYLYMSYYRATTLDNVMTQGKQALRENLRQSLNNKPLQSPNPSKLQKQVERCIRQKLKFRVESEKVINGLPVDMYLPDHHAIVQVNGPSHYVYKDSEQNRQLSIKDRFHEAIVQMPAITSTTVMPDYKIIHIDYQQFSQNGKSYIENQLRQAGLLKGKVTNLGVFADHNQQKQSSQLTSVKRNEQRFTA